MPQDKVTQEKVKEVGDVKAETETYEEPSMKILARTMSNEKNKKKKIKESVCKRKTLKRRLVISSDSKLNV